jgi:hypothetical protein
MATRLEMLQTLSDRLEAEQLQAVETLANGETSLSALSDSSIRRIADLHTVLAAVRDEVSRHGPKMGFGSDPLERA